MSSGIAFTVGVTAERSGHHETAAEHPGEGAAEGTPAPSAAADGAAGSSGEPTAAASADLSAPEGSRAREAAERATEASSAEAEEGERESGSAETVPTIAPDPAAREGSAAREAAEHAGGETSEAGERLFGLDTESNWLVGLVDAITATLALLILLAPAPAALGVAALCTAGFSGAATVLDIREALHQHDEARPGLVGAAVGVGVLHLLCALVASALLAWCRAGRATQV